MALPTAAVLAAFAAAPIVSVPGVGKLRGTTRQGVESFLGIPYAAPPVGDLRFQPPEPATAWTGVREAVEYGNTCWGSNCTGTTSSEDCLFLNVFRPSVRSSRKLPVMVWIHGGSYTLGCSNNYAGWKQIPVTGDVVLVTTNYRLGPIGFLGSRKLAGKDGSSGNFGLQDQRQAVRWVREHIAAFGGDDTRVTIFGESAGAGSVAAHVVAERSWPYYDRAIMQSGAGAIWNTKPMRVAEMLYENVSTYLGCTDADCVKAKPASDIIKAATGVAPSGADSVYIPWSPVIDGVELDDSVYELAKRGHTKRGVETVLGTLRDEEAYFLIADSVPTNLTEDAFNTRILPTLRNQRSLLPIVKRLYDPATYHYPANLGSYSRWWWTALAMTTDMAFTCPNRRFANALVSNGAIGTYTYYFVHPSQTPSNIPGTGPGSVVVPHASDIMYVFDCAMSHGKNLTQCPLEGAGEQNLSELMASAWGRFATGGSPQAVEGVQWPRFDKTLSYSSSSLVFDVAKAFGGEGIHHGGPHVDRQCGFWDSQVPSTH